MNLRQGLDKMKFDVRMVDLNVRTGVVKKEDVKKQNDSLPDLASNAEVFSVDVDSDDMGDSLDNQ